MSLRLVSSVFASGVESLYVWCRESLHLVSNVFASDVECLYDTVYRPLMKTYFFPLFVADKINNIFRCDKIVCGKK